MIDRRLLNRFGLLTPAISLGTLFLATVVDPQYSWATRSLSSMGEATPHSLFALASRDQLAFLLFNSGLVLGGILGQPFAYRLWLDAENLVERAGVATFVVALAAMAGVGVAYLDGPLASLHFLFAVTFFFLGTVALLLYGSGRVLAGAPRTGLAVVWIGVVHLLVWVVWVVLEAMVFTGDDIWTFFAVPEAVGAVAVGGWAFWTAWRYERAARNVTA
ncbi:DUF998 domain-containing protein [Haloarchaeobius sp. TZWWS8]|uniref:DUF998 domain-containing protein n=1 Tax=Haloarchaeobius sp. TZWWS8 TaxID=3446121 RepID=UPI003EBE07C1